MTENRPTRTEEYALCRKKAAAWGIAAAVLICAAAVSLIFTVIFKPLRVFDEGMSPMLEPNDVILVSRLSKYITRPVRGDAVAFKDKETGAVRIGRIVALGGEAVQIQNRRVYINGQLLDERTYVADFDCEDMESFTVPEGSVYILCDARSFATILPERAAIPCGDIIGVIVMRLAPIDRLNVFVRAR